MVKLEVCHDWCNAVDGANINAPPKVRRWLEQELLAAFGLRPPIAGAQAPQLAACSVEESSAAVSLIQGMLPVVNVSNRGAKDSGSRGFRRHRHPAPYAPSNGRTGDRLPRHDQRRSPPRCQRLLWSGQRRTPLHLCTDPAHRCADMAAAHHRPQPACFDLRRLRSVLRRARHAARRAFGGRRTVKSDLVSAWSTGKQRRPQHTRYRASEHLAVEV
jgi:hypothetical protein